MTSLFRQAVLRLILRPYISLKLETLVLENIKGFRVGGHAFKLHFSHQAFLLLPIIVGHSVWGGVAACNLIFKLRPRQQRSFSHIFRRRPDR